MTTRKTDPSRDPYVNQHKKEHYDRLTALLPKGKGKLIDDLASKTGKSKSDLVVEALEAQYGLDLGGNGG